MARLKSPGERKIQVSLYLASDRIAEIDAQLGERTRNEWLTEAIEEKLARERAESGKDNTIG